MRATPTRSPASGQRVEALGKNVTVIAERLRKAAGSRVRIVGTTYPDVLLGRWVGPDADQGLARASVVAFKQLINPALEQAYASAGGRFVDVTAATGAYGPLDATTTVAAYGVIPLPVAKVCEYSYYCEFRDIHARTNGYELIAELIVKTLPRRGGRSR